MLATGRSRLPRQTERSNNPDPRRRAIEGAAMSQNRTTATDAGVEAHLAAIADEARRKECEALIALLGGITGEAPKLWGPSIVGFGTYHYRYESGREGDWCATGFAARKNDLAVYLIAEGPQRAALLARLGKHRMGKSCLYLKRLADVDMDVLRTLVEDSVAEVRRRYGQLSDRL